MTNSGNENDGQSRRQRLRILAPTRYPWRFNGPRRSAHEVTNRAFVPFNYLSAKAEGVTVFNPLPPRRFDLIHAFNRLPIGRTPYLIGFESHLPRAFGLERSCYYRTLIHSLSSDRCRGIFAISEHARNIFLRTARHLPQFPELEAKLSVRYPNLSIETDQVDLLDPGSEDLPVRLVFVGSHFARKGGCVAVRLAEISEMQKFPLSIDIISDLRMGGGIWTDPAREGYFSDWQERLMNRSNVTVYPGLPNTEVLNLLKQAHFSLLPTFCDTFGYSALESMANYTPVIATAQGALPEFIKDRVNGILLPLDTNPEGEWIHSGGPGRDTLAFEKLFTSEIERLAQLAFSAIVQTVADPLAFAGMRQAARKTVCAQFDADDANAFWDRTYESLAD